MLSLSLSQNKSLALICLLPIILTLIGCDKSENQNQMMSLSEISESPLKRGIIWGSISPITAYDAEILLFQNGEYLKKVKVKDGAFEATELSPGFYHIMIVATGFFTNITLKSVYVNAGETTNVGRVALLEKVELGWESPKISGRITDAETKEPIAMALVHLECGDGVCFFDSQSDDEGKYIITVWPDLVPILRIAKAGYKSFGKEFAPMRRGERDIQDVELERLKP